MNAKTINRLLISVAVLSIVYLLVLFWQYRQTLPEINVSFNPSGMGRSMDKLVVRSDKETVSLSKKGGKWFVGNKPVAEIKISTVVSAIEKLKFVRTVSRDGAGQLDGFGLTDKEANMLSIYQNRRLVRTLIFGKMATSESYYIKFKDEPAVYEAQGDLIFEVGQPANSWAQKTEKPTPVKKRKAEH